MTTWKEIGKMVGRRERHRQFFKTRTYEGPVKSTVGAGQNGGSYKKNEFRDRNMVYLYNYFYKYNQTNTLNHVYHPPRHAADKGLQVCAITHLLFPQPFDGLLQLGDTGVVLLQLLLHPGSAILYWVEVGGLARPLDEGDVGPPLEPLGHNLGLVAGGRVLQKVVTAVLLHHLLQLLVPYGIHNELRAT